MSVINALACFYTRPIFKSLILQPDTNGSSIGHESYNDTLQRFIFSWSANVHMVLGLRSTISGYSKAIIAFAISVFFAFQKTLHYASSATAFH